MANMKIVEKSTWNPKKGVGGVFSDTKFIDTSHECKQMMIKLSKGALKDAGKIVTKILKDTVPVRTGNFKKSIKAWVKIDYKTGQPYLQVGYLNRKQMLKRGVKFFVNPAWFEFGVRSHTIKSEKKVLYHKNNFGKMIQHPGMSGRNFLKNTVMNNIDEIKSAQKEKLGRLTDILIEQGVSVDLGGDEEID